jgi:hypothetical protein
VLLLEINLKKYYFNIFLNKTILNLFLSNQNTTPERRNPKARYGKTDLLKSGWIPVYAFIWPMKAQGRSEDTYINR